MHDDVTPKQPSAAAATTTEHVAGWLETVYEANGLIADEVDRIIGSHAPVSQSMISRLARLGDELQPGANARAQLANLDPGLLLAGTSMWIGRRRTGEASAATRAEARWSAGLTA
jgi:hypothetical protein